MTSEPREFAVVVPAHDEAETISACVDSIHRAAAHLPSHIRCTALVVADTCSDDTAQIAARAGAVALRGDWGNVGRTRTAGATAALRARGTDGLWLACTDADSQVPDNWLCTHLNAARHGWQAVLGTIALATPHDLSPSAHSRFTHTYRPHEGHNHVHGANLTLDATTYLHAGGFPPIPTGEDAALAHRLRRIRTPLLATSEAAVSTSTRTHGRAPDGFATDLRHLDDTT